MSKITPNTEMERIIKSFDEKFYYCEKENRLISRGAEGYDSVIPGATDVEIKRFLREKLTTLVSKYEIEIENWKAAKNAVQAATREEVLNEAIKHFLGLPVLEMNAEAKAYVCAALVSLRNPKESKEDIKL